MQQKRLFQARRQKVTSQPLHAVWKLACYLHLAFLALSLTCSLYVQACLCLVVAHCCSAMLWLGGVLWPLPWTSSLLAPRAPAVGHMSGLNAKLCLDGICMISLLCKAVYMRLHAGFVLNLFADVSGQNHCKHAHPLSPQLRVLALTGVKLSAYCNSNVDKALSAPSGVQAIGFSVAVHCRLA